MFILRERGGGGSRYDSSFLEYLDFSFQRIPWSDERGAATFPGHGWSAQCSINPRKHYRVAMSSRYSGHRRACSRDLSSGQDGVPWRLRHLWACAVLQGKDEVLASNTGTSNSGSLFSEATGRQHHPWYDRRVSVKSSKFQYTRDKTIQFNRVIILGDSRTSDPHFSVHFTNSVFASHFFYHFLRQWWN